MTPAPAHRYLYSGHTVGAAAQFHRLDDDEVDHVIPTLAASVIPVTGGLSKNHADNYCYQVDHPSHRTLMAVRHIESMAAGREFSNRFETEIETGIESIHILEKLHIEKIELHVFSTLKKGETEPQVTTKGNKIDGMRLGHVIAKIKLDDDPLHHCGTKDQLAQFYKKQSAEYRREHSWRFNTPPDSDILAAPHGHYVCSLVREIKLEGPPDELRDISVEGYTIRWKEFGRIILGEVVVKGNDRQVTMVRLAMGSNAVGQGAVGCGQTNGSSTAS